MTTKSVPVFRFRTSCVKCCVCVTLNEVPSTHPYSLEPKLPLLSLVLPVARSLLGSHISKWLCLGDLGGSAESWAGAWQTVPQRGAPGVVLTGLGWGRARPIRITTYQGHPAINVTCHCGGPWDMGLRRGWPGSPLQAHLPSCSVSFLGQLCSWPAEDQDTSLCPPWTQGRDGASSHRSASGTQSPGKAPLPSAWVPGKVRAASSAALRETIWRQLCFASQDGRIRTSITYCRK